MYFNEIDPFTATWLGNLYPAATVDQRSIEDVQPSDLDGIRRCHFFAGIGGWEYALALAGWPADRPVWTGSCPCQPFSISGKQEGGADARHLWPAWYRLIRECRPAIVFGEQVPRAIAHGWLDAVFTDLEAEGYACGAVVLGACGVGAPHRRQRLYWVADARDDRAGGEPGKIGGFRRGSVDAGAAGIRFGNGEAGTGGAYSRSSGLLADTRRGGIRGGGPGPLAGAPVGVQGTDGQRERVRADVGSGGAALGGLANTQDANGRGAIGAADAGRGASQVRGSGDLDPWRDAEWIYCRDGKHRPTKPGIHPLATGVPGRVGRLRAYGNAIVPQVAAEFIRAFMEIEA